MAGFRESALAREVACGDGLQATSAARRAHAGDANAPALMVGRFRDALLSIGGIAWTMIK